MPWTKPADLPYDSNKPLPKLGGPFADAIHAAFADGSVAPLKRNFDEKKMRQAILRDDGEPQNAQDSAPIPPRRMATRRGPNAATCRRVTRIRR